MKIKQEQIERLAGLLLARYRDKELMVPKHQEPEIRSEIIKIITRNFAEEDAIEEEARKMLASHAGEVRDMDHFKMFILIKQKLAAKKDFIL
jgi:hypothetical protein